MRMVPLRRLLASQFFSAIPADVDAVPKRWCPHACPLIRPRNGDRSGSRLRHARQRIHFGKYADHRLAASVLGDEGRRHLGHAGTNGEACIAQFFLQTCTALHFLIADLGPIPQFERHRAIGRTAGLDRAQHRVVGCGNGHAEQSKGDSEMFHGRSILNFITMG